jgi:hypothetical protein
MKVRCVDVGRVWDSMVCGSVNEEGGDVEGTVSEAPSPLSYTGRGVVTPEARGLVRDTRNQRLIVVVYYESMK